MITRTLWAAFLLIPVACAAGPPPVTTVLPFTVAMDPIQVAEETPILAGSKLDLSMSLDEQDLSRRIAEILEDRCFARMLPLEGDRGPGRGSDLLLVPRLRFSREIRTSSNDLLWLNLIAFQFVGPISYYLKDRTYYCSASLVLEVHDVSALTSGGGSRVDGRARITSATARVGSVDLAFVDRTTNVGTYLASLILPVTLLANENEVVRQSIEEQVMDRLANEVCEGLIRQERLLLKADQIARFWIEPESARAVREVTGEISVVAWIFHCPSRRREEIERYEVRAGEVALGRVVRTSDGESVDSAGDLGDDVRRYAIDATVHAATDVGWVQIRIWDSEENQRSFTVKVLESKQRS